VVLSEDIILLKQGSEGELHSCILTILLPNLHQLYAGILIRILAGTVYENKLAEKNSFPFWL
jgi:hypothetical protein